MKVTRHTLINDKTINIHMNDCEIHGVNYSIVVQVETIGSLIKKVNFVTIENDLPVCFEEIDENIQDKILNLAAEYLEKNI